METEGEISEETALVEYVAAHIAMCVAANANKFEYLDGLNISDSLQRPMSLSDIRTIFLKHPLIVKQLLSDEIPF